MTRRKKKGQSGSVSQLVDALNRAVANLEVSAPRKKKPKRRKRKGKGLEPSEGSVRIVRTEFLATIKVASGASTASGHVDLVPDSFSYLANLAKSFEKSCWNDVEIFYKPAVGTTVGGLLTVGMDWDFVGEDVARNKLTGYTPNFTTAVWGDSQNRAMRLPRDKLQNLKWYLHNSKVNTYQLRGPGKIHWAVDASIASTAVTLGELHIRYSITLAGSSPV